MTHEVNLHHIQKANLWHLLHCLEGQLCDFISVFETLKCGGNTWSASTSMGIISASKDSGREKVFCCSAGSSEHQPFTNLGSRGCSSVPALLGSLVHRTEFSGGHHYKLHNISF